jgi:hypothetical protein
VNALAKPEVGSYLNRSFVAAYQKVGTFTLNGQEKQGGNVAAYFCTPDRRVIHAVAGPVKAAVLLREARWAVETHKLAQLEEVKDSAQLRSFYWHAHAERLRQEHGLDLTGANPTPRRKLGNQGSVHLILTAAPLARLDRVYKLVFERILGEKISTAPVAQNEG